MAASGRAWLWLTGGCGAFALGLVGACSGAAPSDLLTAHRADTPDATAGSSSGDGGKSGSGGGNSSGDDAADEGGPPAGNCTADTCAGGCCDSNGRCASGDQDNECGNNGVDCEDCTSQQGSCAAKTCIASSTSSGSGGMGSSGSGSSSGAICMPLVCPACVFGAQCCTTAGACGCGFGTLCQ